MSRCNNYRVLALRRNDTDSEGDLQYSADGLEYDARHKHWKQLQGYGPQPQMVVP